MTTILTITFLLVLVNSVYSTLKYRKGLLKIRSEKYDKKEFKEKMKKLVIQNFIEVAGGLLAFTILSYIVALMYQK